MASRNIHPGRLFRAPPEDLEKQSEIAKVLGLNWSEFARAAFDTFTVAKVLLVTHKGRTRKRSIPAFNVRALIIVGDGPPYFLQRHFEGNFEPVQSLAVSFAQWELTPQDFEEPKLVKRHLDASPYQAVMKPTKGAK